MTFLTRPFFGFIFAMEPVWIPLLIADVITFLILIFKEKLEPRTLIFWVSVVAIVPFAGILLYLLYGCTLFSNRNFTPKRDADSRFLSGDADAPDEGCKGMVKVLSDAGADIHTAGNLVKAYWNRSDCIQDLVSDLDAAGRYIHIMLYQAIADSEVVDVLKRKAESGVEVLLMTSALRVGRTAVVRELKRAGVGFCTFHRTVYSMMSVRPANRNMRSIVVVDGAVAYQGTETTVRLEGPSVGRLERRFRADWLYGCGTDLGIPDSTGASLPGVGVQIVSDGPDCSEMEPLPACYSEVVSSAEDHLYISTPYLLPNDEIYAAVKLAVLSGVEVRLLLPRRGKHWYQSWNSLAASNPLMEAGVRVFFADKMLSKCVMAADGKVAVIGTGCYCERSLRNDFNSSAVVYSEDLARDVEDMFCRELEDAVECFPEEYGRRSFSDMLKIAAARMLMFLN